MRRRRVVVLALLAMVAVGAVLLWPRGPRPCRATFELVRAGMTFEEVCATVGGPPGDYTSAETSYMGPLSMQWYWSERWRADDAGLWVTFDDGRVTNVYLAPPIGFRPHPTLLDRLRARLGL